MGSSAFSVASNLRNQLSRGVWPLRKGADGCISGVISLLWSASFLFRKLFMEQEGRSLKMSKDNLENTIKVPLQDVMIFSRDLFLSVYHTTWCVFILRPCLRMPLIALEIPDCRYRGSVDFRRCNIKLTNIKSKNTLS